MLWFATSLTLGLALLAAALQAPASSEKALTLEVDSQPDHAEVRLDGRVLGKTPVRLRPSKGDHKLELSQPGYQSASLSIRCQPGQPERVFQRLAPKTARLTLQDSERAEVLLGPGIPRSLTGRGPWSLKPGVYEVTARRGKLLAEPQKFEIKPDQELQVSLVWPAAPAPPPPHQPPRPARPTPAYVPAAAVRSEQPYYPSPPPYRPAPRPYRPRVAPEVLFTPIPPSRPEPPPYQPPVYHPPSDEPLFTPLP